METTFICIIGGYHNMAFPQKRSCATETISEGKQGLAAVAKLGSKAKYIYSDK